MLKDVTLDFGTLIAYLIPGYVALRGMTGLGVGSMDMLPAGPLFEGQQVVTLLVGSLVAGMLLSIVRAIVVERTFSVPLPLASKPHWGRAPTAEVPYGRLADLGRMAAFQEAKASEKRPYQFYGNMLLALALLLAGRLHAGGGGMPAGAVAVIVLSMLFLYTGARSAHYRYVTALKAIESLPDPAPAAPSPPRV